MVRSQHRTLQSVLLKIPQNERVHTPCGKQEGETAHPPGTVFFALIHQWEKHMSPQFQGLGWDLQLAVPTYSTSCLCLVAFIALLPRFVTLERKRQAAGFAPYVAALRRCTMRSMRTPVPFPFSSQ